MKATEIKITDGIVTIIVSGIEMASFKMNTVSHIEKSQTLNKTTILYQIGSVVRGLEFGEKDLRDRYYKALLEAFVEWQ